MGARSGAVLAATTGRQLRENNNGGINSGKRKEIGEGGSFVRDDATDGGFRARGTTAAIVNMLYGDV